MDRREPASTRTAPSTSTLGTRRARAAAGLLLAMPGAVYLYQGEELGLPEWLDMPDDAREDPVFANTGGAKKGRDGCRVPLPWTAEPAGGHGFSPAATTPARRGCRSPTDWGRYAADVQDGDDTSMLELYRRLVAARRALLTADEAELVVDDADDVVAMRRGPSSWSATPVGEPVDVAAAAGLSPVLTTGRRRPTGRRPSPADTTVWFAP